MTPKIKILIGVLVVGIVLVGGWWFWVNQMIGVCSFETPQFCDRSCKTDQDCEHTCCGCISKNEKCSCLARVYVPPDSCYKCKCIDGKCTLKPDEFYITAKETNNSSLCEKVEKLECRDMCYLTLALHTGNMSLCQKIISEGNREACTEKG